MMRGREDGFTMMELMVATGALLAVLSAALYFFSHSQRIYTNERATLDMVQEMRTAFDRLTNEIRMAAAGLPGNRGVISGTPTELIIRGDFSNVTTIVSSLGLNINGVFNVGTADAFKVGQTISLLNTNSGAAGLAKITAVDKINSEITVDKDDFFPITSGAQMTLQADPLTGFPSGTIINVIERRTYRILTSGQQKGSITRTVVYDDTKSAGGVIQPEDIIATNVLTTDDDPGLRFTYYDFDNNVVNPDETGYVVATKVFKVRIDLQARTAARDLQTGAYRTLNLTALIQVRGQYIPKIGF